MTNIVKNRRKNIWIMGLVTLMLTLMACQSVKTPYQGRVVGEENQIALPADESIEGSWTTRDMTVAYQATHTDGHMALLGDVTFDDHLLTLYVDIIVAMRVNIFDGEDKVIASHGITLPRYSRYREVLPFNQKFPWPAEAQGFAFSYNGRARDGGAGGMGMAHASKEGVFTWTFWKAP